MELKRTSETLLDYDFTSFQERIQKTTDLEKLREEKKLIQSYHTLDVGEKNQKMAIIDTQIAFLQRTGLMKIITDRVARAFGQK